MNRNDELKQLLESMEKDAPELGGSIVKAYKRRRGKRAVYHLLTGVAVICGLFVLLVNIYEPFAQLCSQTPGLKALAASVTVNKAWPDEVEDAVQKEEKDTSVLLNKYIEASIQSVTRKGTDVEITYRINAPGYEDLTAWTFVMGFEESEEFAVNNGGVHTLKLDFSEREFVPGSITLLLYVRYDQSAKYPADMAQKFVTFYLDVDLYHDINPKNGVMHADYSDVESDYRIYPMNRLIDMDGQRIMLTYATMRAEEIMIYTAQADSNTSKIVDIYAYTKSKDGKLSELLDVNDAYICINSNALRNANERANSYKSERFADIGMDAIELVIEGVRMLDQNHEQVYVNLATGETGQLPDGVEVHKIYRDEGTWVVEMRAACRISKDDTLAPQTFKIMDMCFFDATGKAYSVNEKRAYYQDYYRGAGYTFVEVLKLTDYPYDEVWLDMAFSHLWELESEMIFTFAR